VAETATIYREPAASETTVAHREPVTSEIAVAHREPVAPETAAAKAVTSSAKTAAVASTASTGAPCERGCAGRRCCQAERDGRGRCNHLRAHFSTPDVSWSSDSVRGPPKRGQPPSHRSRPIGKTVISFVDLDRGISTDRRSVAASRFFARPLQLVQFQTIRRNEHSGCRLQESLAAKHSRNPEFIGRFKWSCSKACDRPRLTQQKSNDAQCSLTEQNLADRDVWQGRHPKKELHTKWNYIQNNGNRAKAELYPKKRSYIQQS
jgi:hypothetical protein